MTKITSRKADAAYEKELKRIWRGDETHFDDAVDFLSAEARYFVLDAISCALHNEGYGLLGNHEAKDTFWLAREIYGRLDGQKFDAKRFDDMTDEERQKWMEIAAVTIECLPRLADRIAARYLALEKSLNLLLRREKYYRLKGYHYADEKEDASKSAQG